LGGIYDNIKVHKDEGFSYTKKPREKTIQVYSLFISTRSELHKIIASIPMLFYVLELLMTSPRGANCI
jgi:hypothetical protein